MHVNMETPMSYIVSSERTSRLPACLVVWHLRFQQLIFLMSYMPHNSTISNLEPWQCEKSEKKQTAAYKYGSRLHCNIIRCFFLYPAVVVLKSLLTGLSFQEISW